MRSHGALPGPSPARLLGSWGNTMRDAVRNTGRWERRRMPTRDISGRQVLVIHETSIGDIRLPKILVLTYGALSGAAHDECHRARVQGGGRLHAHHVFGEEIEMSRNREPPISIYDHQYLSPCIVCERE